MRMRGLDVVGGGTGGLVGVDYGNLVSSIFNTAGAAVDVASQSQAEKADNDKLQAAIAADKAATNAVWRANASAEAAKLDPTKAGAAQADKMAADAAVKVQDKAGAAVPDSKKADRVKAAQAAVDAANQDLQDALRANDKAKQLSAQAELDAANQTLDKATGDAPAGNVGHGKGGKGAPAGSASVFDKKLVGPVKVKHVLEGLGAIVVGTVAVKALRK